jgi:holin-like protein
MLPQEKDIAGPQLAEQLDVLSNKTSDQKLIAPSVDGERRPPLTAKIQLADLVGKAAAPIGGKHLRTWSRLWIDFAAGFTSLVVSLWIGEQVKAWLHLPIPGNVLGLFILLICFRFRLVSPRLIQEASNRLLFVLPALFIPIYVSAIGQGQLWSQLGWLLLPVLLIATAGLWVFVGHLSQRLLSRNDPSRHE